MAKDTILKNKETLIKVVKDSINVSDALKKLGFSGSNGNSKTFYKYIKKYEIDISHFTGKAIKYRNSINLDDILSNKTHYYNSHNLKNHLYKAGLKKPICELCGQDENWKGQKISLILDHIDGNRNNNNLENLRIVCPNCDAALPTYKGKNRKNKEYETI